jgi:hypothetical protein
LGSITVLETIPGEEKNMQIFVKNLNGRTITYEVLPTDPILTLKHLVRQKEGIPMTLIRLVYSGKNLDGNDRTFVDFEIPKESTIQLFLKMSGSYCIGCVLPALICLSAHVSLQCGEILSFDDKQLLHRIKTNLTSLNNGAMEAVIDCIQTCGYAWNILENDDADYFQDHAQ